MSAVVSASGVDAGYGTEAVVVRGLDLEVRAGEVVALFGPNGAGKTTTILTLAGELKPFGGEVRWLGERTTAPLHLRARGGLGLVTEQRSVHMRMTLDENLRVGRCDRSRAFELFPELVEHASRRVQLLSGGQQQMLAVARALSRPGLRVLLVDELSFGLAPLVVRRLLDALRRAANDGLAVLLVEQHVHEAMRIADRVYVMQRGRIELAGSASDLRTRIEEIQQTYLSSQSQEVTAYPKGITK